jgi:hypothetical protein
VIATSGTAAALSDALLAGATGLEAGRGANPAGKGAAAKDADPPCGHGATRGAQAGQSWPKMSLPEREAVPGIGPRRAEIIVAGAQVSRSCWRASGCPGFAIRRWGCATAFWRRCWPSRTRGPRRIGVRARALGERAGDGAALRRRSQSRPSRCGRTRCSCFAS